uniref:Uncharacterized protein n=1 Tax=Rhizobium meliloti TaxID=382 RepID=I2E1G4_RHIML|nr:short hypothetical protein [Sinorhizobium meliloti]
MEAVHTVNVGAFGGGRNRYLTARDDRGGSTRLRIGTCNPIEEHIPC